MNSKRNQRRAAARNPNLGDNGRAVRVGSIVIDDGPTCGRVIYVRDGAVIYRDLTGRLSNRGGGSAIPASASELTVLS